MVFKLHLNSFRHYSRKDKNSDYQKLYIDHHETQRKHGWMNFLLNVNYILYFPLLDIELSKCQIPKNTLTVGRLFPKNNIRSLI